MRHKSYINELEKDFSKIIKAMNCMVYLDSYHMQRVINI